MAVSDAELDDIQRDAESTARLVGMPGCAVRQRAEATVRLVAEVRRLRGLVGEAAVELHELDRVDPDDGSEDLIARLRAAGGDS